MIGGTREVIAGVIVTVTGIAFLLASLSYGLGTLTSMQAGFFPAAAATANILFGLGILVRALRPTAAEAERERVDWRPLVAVCAGIAGFSLVIDEFGFLLAVALAVALSAAGDKRSSALGTAVLILVLAMCVWLVFSAGLAVPVPALRI